jgi:hypothetical protein
LVLSYFCALAGYVADQRQLADFLGRLRWRRHIARRE